MKQRRQRSLFPIAMEPGIVKDVSRASAQGRWIDAINVRFRLVSGNAFPEKIGGWSRKKIRKFRGSARTLHAWRLLNGNQVLGIGTNTNLLAFMKGGIHDLTPIIKSMTGTNLIETEEGSSAVLVTYPEGFSSVAGDEVVLKVETSVGGYPVAALNGSHVITRTISASQVEITLSNPALTTETGGGEVEVGIALPAGLDTTIYGSGFGAGVWGGSEWGMGSDSPVYKSTLAIWSMDNFGQDLVACRRGSPIYLWSSTFLPGERAKDLGSFDMSVDAPTAAEFVLVSEQDGHVIAFGCDEILGNGRQNPMHIRWSSQENPYDWRPTDTNTSGGVTLSKGSRIMGAVQTKSEILVFTDKALYGMRYIGGNYVFSVTLMADNISVISPLSIVAKGDSVYWAGKKGFFQYSGRVAPLECPLEDWMWETLNESQYEKVTGGLNSKDDEIFWFFPSGESSEVDQGVFFSESTGAWSRVNFGRTAWHDSVHINDPIAAFDGYLYDQEVGSDAVIGGQSHPILSMIEAAPVTIGDGQDVMLADRIIYDILFLKGTPEDAEVNFDLQAFKYPGEGDMEAYQTSASKTVSIVARTHTPYKDVRLRGRAIGLKISNEQVGVKWRLGIPKVRARTDGER